MGRGGLWVPTSDLFTRFIGRLSKRRHEYKFFVLTNHSFFTHIFFVVAEFCLYI